MKTKVNGNPRECLSNTLRETRKRETDFKERCIYSYTSLMRTQIATKEARTNPFSTLETSGLQQDRIWE